MIQLIRCPFCLGSGLNDSDLENCERCQGEGQIEDDNEDKPVSNYQLVTQCQECGEEISPEVEKAYKWLYGASKPSTVSLAAAIEENVLKNVESATREALADWMGAQLGDFTAAARHRIDEMRKES